MLLNSISLSNIIFRDDPKIIGTTIKKENLAATSLFNPKKIEVPIVAPLLEIPGNIANAWEKPTRKDFGKLNLFVVFVLKSDINKIIDVNINIDPTKTKLPSKKFDIFSSKRKPTTPAGIIEIIMSLKKC